jgi:hypothetical protein
MLIPNRNEILEYFSGDMTCGRGCAGSGIKLDFLNAHQPMQRRDSSKLAAFE